MKAGAECHNSNGRPGAGHSLVPGACGPKGFQRGIRRAASRPQWRAFLVHVTSTGLLNPGSLNISGSEGFQTYVSSPLVG